MIFLLESILCLNVCCWILKEKCCFMILSEVLLLVCALITIAMVLAGLCHHFSFPYTVVLVISGVLINIVAPSLPVVLELKDFTLTPELVMFVFLPALIFDSALTLDGRALLKSILPVLLMAVPGMLISTFLVGGGIWAMLDVQFVTALVFGALISATDPVAVVAIFKELGVSHRLMALIEGESLFNDATAIVLFNILLGFALSGQVSLMDSAFAFVEFLKVFLGGVLVGVLVGCFMSQLIVMLYYGNQGVMVVLTATIAYFSFIIAEHSFHVSGVMSVLSATICFNIFGLSRLPRETSAAVHDGWDVIVLVCNTMLFLLIGMTVNLSLIVEYWQVILLAAMAVMLARAVSVYGFLPAILTSFSLPRVSIKERHVMWWGGLKGGLAVAIVLSIPDSLPEKQLLLALTLGSVLISLILNATTMKALIRYFKLDRLTESEWSELQQKMHSVKQMADSVLEKYSRLRLLDECLHLSVGTEMDKKFQNSGLSLTEEEYLDQLHLKALKAEQDELDDLHENGLLSHYAYVNFRDILRRDRERSFDSLLKFKHKAGKENLFFRLEGWGMHILGLHRFTERLLKPYQALRYTHKIQHDLAGVVMANAALKMLKGVENVSLAKDKAFKFKKIYRSHLQQRQQRLKVLSEANPVYYQHFGELVFQQVALRHALKKITIEFEKGHISSKVFARIKLNIQQLLNELPKLKTTLSSEKRNDWLQNVPLFSGLSAYILEQLADNAVYVSYLPGDVVFNENDRSDLLHILVKGQVNVFQENEQGENECVAELEEGSLIGKGALHRETPRSATVRAKTYVTLLSLTAREVIELSKTSPELDQRLKQLM